MSGRPGGGTVSHDTILLVPVPQKGERGIGSVALACLLVAVSFLWLAALFGVLEFLFRFLGM